MKKYDAYKDSGVKWIGEIPNHWEVVPLKRTGSFENGLTYSPNDIRDKGYIVLRSSNIQNSKMNYEDTVYVESVPNDLLVKKGDIIICSRNGSASLVGKCAKFDGKIAATFGAFMMRYSPSINNEYAFFSFQILMRNYKGLFTTSTINQLTKNVIAQMVCPLPPLSEQQAIASYLDAKTEKIDKMIAKAEKKIEYLDELKQSLITRAVIRGLNPNAPLKDSGMKWIGEIPEHWKIMPFKYYGKLCKGLTFSKADLTATGVPVISYGQIHSKENKSVRFFEEGIRFIPRELAKNGDSALVKQGDFIFADTSEDLEGCGNCVYNDTTNPIYAGYHTIIYKTRERDCKYLAYLFRSNVWRSQIRCRVSGIKVYSITQGIMSQVNILLPPMSEQKEISTYLDTKCSKIDHIIATQKKKIAYLQELKQSLITNVVTGKIKVS